MHLRLSTVANQKHLAILIIFWMAAALKSVSYFAIFSYRKFDLILIYKSFKFQRSHSFYLELCFRSVIADYMLYRHIMVWKFITLKSNEIINIEYVFNFLKKFPDPLKQLCLQHCSRMNSLRPTLKKLLHISLRLWVEPPWKMFFPTS